MVDQVAGGAENLYGRARSVAEDAIDAAPGFVDEAKERLDDAADRARDVADRAAERTRDVVDRAADRAHDLADRAGDAAARGTRAANATVSDNPASWAMLAAVGAGIGGYLLGWLIHRERA